VGVVLKHVRKGKEEKIQAATYRTAMVKKRKENA
jgi:hypothetical protein